jgi:hypothetical protein
MTTTAAVPGCPVDESFDPLSPEFLPDPYAVLATLPGDGAPVFFAPSITIAELARRYPDLALVPDQEFTFHANISFRRPQVLLVRTN